MTKTVEELSAEVEELQYCIVEHGTNVSLLTIVLQSLARSLSSEQRRTAHGDAMVAMAAIMRPAPDEEQAHWKAFVAGILAP